MKRLSTLLMATAMALPALGAVAEEHLVSVERYGFYPAKVYVEAGDTIRFVNNTTNWVYLFSFDSSDNSAEYNWSDPCDINDANGNGQDEYNGNKDGFSVPWFSVGQEVVINVTSCMETKMYEPYVNQNPMNWNNLNEFIVFGHAPNG